MAIEEPPIIDASPEVPQRGDRSTFAPRVDAFITWMANGVTQFSAVAANVMHNAAQAMGFASAAQSSATNASASAVQAQASADAASATVGATEWVSGQAYAEGQAVWSPITYQTYRRLNAGSGVIDPSIDSANWTSLGASLSQLHATALSF